MRSTLTTAEAAYWLGIDKRSFARWARKRGLEPLRRMRIGESFRTVWARDALVQAVLLDTKRSACSNSHDRTQSR